MNKDYKKLYEEALERAKIKRDEYMRLDGPESYVPQDIEYIFPELAESEDEKIRKTLLNHFKERIPLAVTWYGVKTSDIIAWLEKKGEQKPNFCHCEVDFSNCSEEYRKAYYDGWNNCNQQHKKMKNLQKPAWSEEDEDMLSDCIGAVMAADWYSLEDKEEIESWLRKKFGKNEEQ